MNEIIRKVAAKYKTGLLDMGQIFQAVGKVATDNDSLIQNELNSGKTDGVHPTPNCYRFMTLSIFEYIMYKNLPKNGIVCFGGSITNGDGSIDDKSYPGYLNKLLSSVR